MANTTIKKTPLSTPVVSTQETNTATTLSVEFFDEAGGAHSLNIPITTGHASSPECYYNDQNDRYSASDMSVSEYMVTGYYKNSSNETKYISLTIRNGNVVMPSSYPDSYSGIKRKPTVSIYASNIRKVTYDGNTIYIPLVRQSATVEGFLIEEIDLNNSYFGKVNTDGTYDIYKDNGNGTKTVISLSSSGEFTEAYMAEEVEIPSGSKKDLGLVTAYGAAKEGGYTGTYEEYKEKMLELLNLNLSTLGNEYDDTELRNLINGKMDKVNLARVATSGNYYDLSDRPTIPSVPSSIVNGVKGNNESSYRTGNVNITPSNLGLATVATSGSYDDLRNKPTIPSKVYSAGNFLNSVNRISYASNNVSLYLTSDTSMGDVRRYGNIVMLDSIVYLKANVTIPNATEFYVNWNPETWCDEILSGFIYTKVYENNHARYSPIQVTVADSYDSPVCDVIIDQNKTGFLKAANTSYSLTFKLVSYTGNSIRVGNSDIGIEFNTIACFSTSDSVALWS